MLFAHRFNADAGFTVSVKSRDVAQHQAHFARRFQTLQHLLVQRFAVLKEVIDRPLFAVGGHQRLNAHLIRLDVVTRLTGQDHQLAHDVFPGEIDARVRFRQPLLPGLIDEVCKRHGAVKLQEQP